MAITSIDALIAAARQTQTLQKASLTAEGAGTWSSLWKVAGVPTAGSNPPAFSAGSGYVPTLTTTGAVAYTNPTGGANSYLMQATAQGATVGTLMIYDRLWHCSGFGTVSTSLQSITTPGTISSRDGNGAALGKDVELWLEVYTAPGATGATWTITYTDQDGNTGVTTTYAHPANAESVGQTMPVLLAAGDTGVRAVASFQASGSSGTAGDIGVTLRRRLATLPMTLANVATVYDFASLGLPRLFDDSCLELLVQCTTTNTGLVMPSIVVAQG
jgi:hypothetical protein